MSNASIDAKLTRLDELEHCFAEAVEHAKLEAMKELAYGVGREINNPLANIATRAQTLLQEETDPQKRRKLAAISL
jgi:nitrogen-specific signal transduction histidine kinase